MAEQEPTRRGLPGSEKLAHLDCFDPKAFQSDDAGEQEVCDFVLMLAVVYNDFKDLLWAIDHLKKCDPSDGEINPSNGELAGMRGHVTRQFHSLIFEFAKLLRTQELVLKHPLFFVQRQLKRDTLLLKVTDI